MNTGKALLISAGLMSAQPCLALDKETAALLQKLSRQIAQLQAKSEASDQQIQQLQQSLAEEKAKNRQAPEPAAGRPAASALPELVTPQPLQAAASPTPAKSESRPPVTLGDVKGSFKIPGTDTSLGLGGYVKLDINESSVGTGNGDYAMNYSTIPVGSRTLGPSDQLAFNARETRLWLKSFTPSKWGDINTYVEFDLYGSGYAYAPNLRHAYGSFGQLLAGQTWTTFLNDSSLADVLDNTGPVGTPKQRQPLLRWTQPFTLGGQNFEWLTAIESPRSSLAVLGAQNAVVAPAATGGSRYPDLVGRLNYKGDWGNVSLAAMLRDVRYAAPPLTQKTANELGGAVSLAGKLNLFSLDNFRFSLNYGNALGAYLNATPFEDGVVSGVNTLILTNAYSAMLAYQHWWNEQWRSNFAYGYEQADRPITLARAVALSQQVQSIHANLLWNPLPQAMLGLEYSYGARTLVDGGNGNLSRVQFSAKYSF